MSEEQGHTFLKSIADKLSAWDQDLAKFQGRASEVAGEKKESFDKLAEEVGKQAEQLKGKVNEFRGKSSDEIKTDAEELLQKASGKIAEGLQSLSKFFENKSSGGEKPPEGP